MSRLTPWGIAAVGKERGMSCKIEKWRRWITKDIWPEVLFLLTTKIIYEKMENVIRTKRDLSVHSNFYWWIRRMYASTASSAIRRQTDLDTQCISIAGLLSEIEETPSLSSAATMLNAKNRETISNSAYWKRK
jgi:hypothetical protein